MLADSLDHVEWINKFRCDGISSSIYSIIITVTMGISTGLFNFGLSAVHYVAPASDGSFVPQAAGVQQYFVFGYFLVPAIASVLVAVLCIFHKLDKELPGIQKDIIDRRRAEAAARGEVYLSAEEKAALEQQESDCIAEENRIRELKELCARKGLSFAEEEAKYQAKLAAQKAKEAAKKAKKRS